MRKVQLLLLWEMQLLLCEVQLLLLWEMQLLCMKKVQLLLLWEMQLLLSEGGAAPVVNSSQLGLQVVQKVPMRGSVID